MRIVSLLPSVTEWVCAFGARDDLVGRSHACDYPPSVVDVPSVTRPTMDTSGDAAELDKEVRRRISEGLNLYEVDLERLDALAPDLVVTQDQCEVCAVSLEEIEEDLRSVVSSSPSLLSVAPSTLKDVFDTALRVGRAIDRLQAAMEEVAAGEKHLRTFMDQIGISRQGNLQGKERPSVLCMEWLEPPMVAGHWTPDIVEKAGGRAVFAESGEPSRYIAWENILDEDPDVIVLLPCGYTIPETRENLHYCREQPEWSRLRAVREEQVFLFDGSSYFNRPGPRLYRSIELLGKVLHPERVDSLHPPLREWELQPVAHSSSASRA